MLTTFSILSMDQGKHFGEEATRRLREEERAPDAAAEHRPACHGAEGRSAPWAWRAHAARSLMRQVVFATARTARR